MNGMEDRFPFNIRRRWAFRADKATWKAEGMYCLYTAWRALRFLYAARVSRARDRMSSLSAIRIDSFTRSRNSARSQSSGRASHVTRNTRARWASTPLPGARQASSSLGEMPECENLDSEGLRSGLESPPFITRLVPAPRGHNPKYAGIVPEPDARTAFRLRSASDLHLSGPTEAGDPVQSGRGVPAHGCRPRPLRRVHGPVHPV